MADLTNSGTIFDAPVDPSFVKPARTRVGQSAPKQSKLMEALSSTLLPGNYAASLPSIEAGAFCRNCYPLPPLRLTSPLSWPELGLPL